MFMAGKEIAISASQLQEIMNAVYIAEGNGDAEFDSDMIGKVNEIQRHLDRYLILPLQGDEQTIA
jgi:hypothetical protein